MVDISYEDFCKETRCVHYNLIERLKSAPKSSQIERELGIARVHCEQNCERTAYQYYQWIEEKKISQWLKQKS